MRQNKRAFELFRLIDRAVRDYLLRDPPEVSPLLIPAGVEWVVQVFREASTYPAVSDASLHGNFKHRPEHELYAPARAIAASLHEHRITEATERYRQQRGTSGVATDQAETVSMAMMGQVHALLVDLDAEAWGTADVSTAHVDVHRQRRDGDQDLVELAVLHTLLHGGDVTALPHERMPDAGPLLAVLRRGAAALKKA